MKYIAILVGQDVGTGERRYSMYKIISVALLGLFLVGCAVPEGGGARKKAGGSLFQPQEQPTPTGEQPVAPVGK